MEFRFDINDMFKQPIVKIGPTLIPDGFKGDKRQLRDTISKVTDVVNAMGAASANAQGLSKSITSADRLRNSDHQILYLLIDAAGNQGKGAVTSMLKTGRKVLYVFDRDGHHCQVQAPCVLDFYVHESRQRSGLGHRIFEFMLKNEDVQPQKLAIDRPSDKFLAFLRKHYALNVPIRQMNNFVVFDGFFSKVDANGADATSPHGELAHKGSNGLQSQMLTSPYGRYGAPRPLCSMGQIIHNQSATVNGNEQSGGEPAHLLNMQHPTTTDQPRPVPLPTSNCGPQQCPQPSGCMPMMVGNGLSSDSDEDRLRRLQGPTMAHAPLAATSAVSPYHWPFALPEQGMYVYDNKRYQHAPLILPANMQQILQPEQFALEKQQAPVKETMAECCTRGHNVQVSPYSPSWYNCPKRATEYRRYSCAGSTNVVQDVPNYEQPQQQCVQLMHSPNVFDPMYQNYWNQYYRQYAPIMPQYYPQWMQMQGLPYYFIPPPPPQQQAPQPTPQLAQIAAPPQPVPQPPATATEGTGYQCEPLVAQPTPPPPPENVQPKVMTLEAEREFNGDAVNKCPVHQQIGHHPLYPCMVGYPPNPSNITVSGPPLHGYDYRMPCEQPHSLPELSTPPPVREVKVASTPALVEVAPPIYASPAATNSTNVNNEVEATNSQQQISYYQNLLTQPNAAQSVHIRPCNPVFGLPAQRENTTQELRTFENAGYRNAGGDMAEVPVVKSYPVIQKSELEPLQPSIPFRRVVDSKSRSKPVSTTKTTSGTSQTGQQSLLPKPKSVMGRPMRKTQSTATGMNENNATCGDGGTVTALAAGGKTPRMLVSQDRALKANVRRAATAKSVSGVPAIAPDSSQTRLAETKELLRKRSAMISQFLARLQ